jgi:hypothetical protein
MHTAKNRIVLSLVQGKVFVMAILRGHRKIIPVRAKCSCTDYLFLTPRIENLAYQNHKPVSNYSFRICWLLNIWN